MLKIGRNDEKYRLKKIFYCWIGFCFSFDYLSLFIEVLIYIGIGGKLEYIGEIFIIVFKMYVCIIFEEFKMLCFLDI